MPARKCILIISAYARTPTHLSFPPHILLSKREKTRTILDSKHAVVRDFDHLFVANPSLPGREKKMAFLRRLLPRFVRNISGGGGGTNISLPFPNFVP